MGRLEKETFEMSVMNIHKIVGVVPVTPVEFLNNEVYRAAPGVRISSSTVLVLGHSC